MTLDPKTTTSNTFKGKIAGSTIFTNASHQPWYTNKLFLAPALFAATGGAVGFVSAQVVKGSQEEYDDFMSTNSPNKLNENSEQDSNKISENKEAHVIISSNLPCGHPDDSLTFGNAFKEQRSELGQGGVFEYRGKYYNTYYKEEWEAMSEDQKHNYFLAIDSKIDYDKSLLVNTSKGNSFEMPISEFNNSTDIVIQDPFIPESQVDEFIPFEYGKGPLESGPGSAHLNPDLDVPATLIVENFAFHNDEDDEYDFIEKNNSNESDESTSNNYFGDEEMQNYSNLNEDDILEVNSIHLTSVTDVITLVDMKDIKQSFYTDDEELFNMRIVEDDTNIHQDTDDDIHLHE